MFNAFTHSCSVPSVLQKLAERLPKAREVREAPHSCLCPPGKICLLLSLLPTHQLFTHKGFGGLNCYKTTHNKIHNCKCSFMSVLQVVFTSLLCFSLWSQWFSDLAFIWNGLCFCVGTCNNCHIPVVVSGFSCIFMYGSLHFLCILKQQQQHTKTKLDYK